MDSKRNSRLFTEFTRYWNRQTFSSESLRSRRRLRTDITKRRNLIHKRKHAFRNPTTVLEFRRIEIELLDPIILSLLTLHVFKSISHFQIVWERVKRSNSPSNQTSVSTPQNFPSPDPTTIALYPPRKYSHANTQLARIVDEAIPPLSTPSHATHSSLTRH